MNIIHSSLSLLLAITLGSVFSLSAKEPPSSAVPSQGETSAVASKFDPDLFARFLGYSRGAMLRSAFGPTALVKESRLPEEAFIEGFRDGITGKESPLPEPEVRAMGIEFDRLIIEANNRSAAIAEAKAAEFFAENGKKSGVCILPSGIQYEVITAGDGPFVEPQGGLRILYRTSLLDGTEIEAKLSREEPFFVTLDQLVEGSRMVSLSMPAGAKWRFWLPARLAYGKTGNLPKIPPGAAICIEQEVVAIFPPGERPSSPSATDSGPLTKP